MNKIEIINLIIDIAEELGLPKTNVPLMRLQLTLQVQTLVPALTDAEFLGQAVRYNLQMWLKSKRKEKPEDIHHKEWLEFFMCFFMKPHVGRINSFINKYYPTISINLAIFVPVVSMIITVFHK